jgi:glycerol-3-phosphate dehydrogenase
MLIDFSKVTITAKEAERLAAVMGVGNWGTMHAAIAAEDDPQALLRMLKTELAGRKRLMIVTRLLSAYHTLSRRLDHETVRALLSKPAGRKP